MRLSCIVLLIITGTVGSINVFAKTASVDTKIKIISDTLSGPLPSVVKNIGIPYIIPSNIEVPPDKTVVIEPGVILLFRNFSGLHVRGKLIARGTPQNPIIFSSEFDKRYNKESIRDANPFDWDGIYMTADAIGTQLTYCSIYNSVYCISSDTKFIRLDPLFLKDNGKSLISIENVEYPLTDTTFSYVLDKKDAIKDGIPIELFSDPLSKKRNVFRVIGLVLTAGGVGSGIYYGFETSKSKSDLRRLSSTDFQNLNQKKADDWKNAKATYNSNVLLCSSGILLAVIGLTGFSWTFTF